MYKVVLYLLDKITFNKISQPYEYFAKRGMQSPLQNSLLLIKHNKEFCLTRGRVYLVFVVHGDWGFGTSAWEDKNEEYWDE